MAEVLGGIGNNIGTTKCNGLPKNKDEVYPVKQENITEDDEEEEEDTNTEHAEQEDSSPSDYEFSLREENIRLKSRLEQAKEGMSTMEKQANKYKEELEKEKRFGDKGIQEVVRKLEHEIQVLEERLDSQRKRYHQEHLLMYEDLKEERVKRQEWKQTYLKSQVAVMAFRRKLSLMKDRVSEQDVKELSKCLELVFHEQDGHLKQDLITKKEQGCVEGKSKYATHISNMYKNSKGIKKVNDNIDPELTAQLPSKRVSDLKSDHGSNTNLYGAQGNAKTSHISGNKHSLNEEEKEDLPKVFIMDDENELLDPSTKNDDFNVKTPTENNSASQAPGVTNQRYELDGNKHHQHLLTKSSQPVSHRQTHERSPQYKHWHHYSVDNPGHPAGQRKIDILGSELISNNGNKKTIVNSLQSVGDSSYKSKFSKYGYNDQLELNVNDTKFLELNFDHAFLKGEFKTSTKYQKSFQQKNGVIVEKEKMEKRLYCVTCDKEVPNRLCGHSNIIIQEKEREFPCPTCARVFTNRSHLKRHNMIHSGEKPFACTYCDKRFNRKSHLSRHLLTHTGEKPFRCPTCDKGFADNSDLKRHKQIHEVTPGLVPILPKDNPTQVQSNQIALSAISTIPSTPMQTAMQTTMQPPMLPPMQPPMQPPMHNDMTEAHVTSVSVASKVNLSLKKKELKYPCNKCGKLFSRKSHLTRHRLTHDKIKIYCDCGRLFRQQAHLQAHLPACVRKREAVEAKYTSDHQMMTQAVDVRNESTISEMNQLVKMEVSINDSPSEMSPADHLSPSTSLVDTSESVQSVDEFKARLAAKFHEGENIGINNTEMKFGEEGKVKEEQNTYISQSNPFDKQVDNRLLNEVSPSETGNQSIVYISRHNANTENLLIVTKPTCDAISNQYVHKTNSEHNLAPLVNENKVVESNIPGDITSEQKMSDINFNLIVKNGSAKLPNDDLALGVDSLPCLPIEIPPLLNE